MTIIGMVITLTVLILFCICMCMGKDDEEEETKEDYNKVPVKKSDDKDE